MIKAIISSYTSSNFKKTNAENNKEVSFKRNDGKSSQSNDEFIKNVEKERDSVISWANKRIDKLNKILEIAKNDDELPKTDKAKIAAYDGIDINDLNKSKSLLNNPHVPQDMKTKIENAIKDAEKLKNETTDAYSCTGSQQLKAVNKEAENAAISHKGSMDNDLDPYTPDPDSTDVPDTDGDSCDGSDSDCDSGCDDSDCLSDTADCIS